MLSIATFLPIVVCLAGQAAAQSNEDPDNLSSSAAVDVPTVNLEERGVGISSLLAKPLTVPFADHALPVTIGSQRVNLMIDTGSTDLAVFLGDCDGCWGSRDAGTFTATGQQGQATEVSYASGTGEGTRYKAPVSIGKKTKKDVQYVAIDTWSGAELPAPLEGLAGLSLAADSLWQRFAKKKVFGLRFVKQRTTIGGLNGHGALTFGGYDKKAVTDPRRIHWCPVVGINDRWTASLEGFEFDGVSEQLDHVALFDSGSNYISGPPRQVRKLYQTLKANGRIPTFTTTVHGGPTGSTVYEFTCVPPTQDFTVSFTINNVVYQLARNDFQVRVGPIAENKCRGAVAANLVPPPGFDWVLGVPFLRTVYTIFDAEQRKIGLYH